MFLSAHLTAVSCCVQEKLPPSVDEMVTITVTTHEGLSYVHERLFLREPRDHFF